MSITSIRFVPEKTFQKLVFQNIQLLIIKE